MTAKNDTPLPPELAEIGMPLRLRIGKLAGYVLYAWVVIGIVALGMRLFLLLFSANVTTPFVQFVLRISDDYLRPFRGIFPSRQIGETSYFDVSALFAIFSYLLLAWLVSELIAYVQSKVEEYTLEQRRKLYYLWNEDKEARQAQRKNPTHGKAVK